MTPDRGDGSVVPEADFRSYYGRPVIKAPVWKHDIAAYLFTGGLAAGSSLLACGADVTGRRGLRRAARLTSLAALAASTGLLIHDLGRPSRFANMLRVFKPTSPMSMGTWILAAFGPASGLAAASELAPLLVRRRRGGAGLVVRLLPGAGRVSGHAAAALSPLLATYTAVLLADTAVPAWHEAHRHLPWVFSGSALASAGGAALLTAPLAETGPARRMAAAGAVVELAASSRLERGLGLQSEAFRAPGPARLLHLSRALTMAGATGALAGRGRPLAVLSGAALLAGSVCTRFGVYRAGIISAQDPRYTIVPQRRRLDAAAGTPVEA
jgi:formate-dependent nitrite reductase membrane component NrfD